MCSWKTVRCSVLTHLFLAILPSLSLSRARFLTFSLSKDSVVQASCTNTVTYSFFLFSRSLLCSLSSLCHALDKWVVMVSTDAITAMRFWRAGASKGARAQKRTCWCSVCRGKLFVSVPMSSKQPCSIKSFIISRKLEIPNDASCSMSAINAFFASRGCCGEIPCSNSVCRRKSENSTRYVSCILITLRSLRRR